MNITGDIRGQTKETREKIDKMNASDEPNGINWWFKNVSIEFSLKITVHISQVMVQAWELHFVAPVVAFHRDHLEPEL